jgi:hypothetical protein
MEERAIFALLLKVRCRIPMLLAKLEVQRSRVTKNARRLIKEERCEDVSL